LERPVRQGDVAVAILAPTALAVPAVVDLGVVAPVLAVFIGLVIKLVGLLVR